MTDYLIARLRRDVFAVIDDIADFHREQFHFFVVFHSRSLGQRRRWAR